MYYWINYGLKKRIYIMKKVILVAVLLVLGSEVVAAVSSGQIACF